MKKNKNLEEIKAYMLKHYEVDNNTFEKDFADFTQVLQHLTLLGDDEN